MNLEQCTAGLHALAASLGLDYDPVEFELVPQRFMLEIAVYGVPVRMNHWSFGLRYMHQLQHQHMGHSRIFEVMFAGNPSRAYIMDGNSLAENVLVTAHVIGHADFVKRNGVFQRFLTMSGGHMLDQSAARAHRLERAMRRHGQRAVEAVLDAALALEPHIDIQQALDRPDYPAPAPGNRSALPPWPEADLLWFIARHAPELADWERDIFLAVREEAFGFYPVHACQIMNEGWASYWHARLLREADFLPQALYLPALRAHTDVVRPYGDEQHMALAINPYHLGFALWDDIIEREGLSAARRICADDDDFSFIRNHLSASLAEQLDLFSYQVRADGDTRVLSRDIHDVREAILTPRYNYGAPSIAVEDVAADGELVLRHDHQRDGRGLDMERAAQVLQYVAPVWRRPVTLHTADYRGVARSMQVTPQGVVHTSATPA